MAHYDPNVMFDDYPRGVPRRSVLATALPWVLVVVLVGGAVGWYLTRYQPMQSGQAKLLATFNERGVELEKIRGELNEIKSKYADVQSQMEHVEGELEKTVSEKKAALAELERAKRDFSSSLESEIASGDVLIEQRGDRLVVNVADKILFPKGEAEVSERGQALLKQVAATLSQIKTHDFQIGGHTDSAPIVSPSVLEHFPTNWELSTARATNVVRFLETEGRVPSGQLVAAGFASYRPAASNQTEAGRRRNRRIEIILFRKVRD
jgi:chemotaxis protein MotB